MPSVVRPLASSVANRVAGTAAAWTIALALVAGGESLADRDGTVVFSLGLGATIGVLIGSLLGAARWLTERVEQKARLTTWALFGATAGGVVALDVGALDRLSGRYAVLAAAALAAGLGGGAALGALVAWLDPRDPDSATRGDPRRLVRWLSMVSGVAVLVWHRQAWWLVPYPSARLAVAAAGWLLLSLPLEAVTHRATQLRLGRVALAIWGAAALALVLVAARAPPDATSPLAEGPNRRSLLLLARGLTDVDRDGESSYFGGRDCAPLDPSVHPRAPEVPANGVDDNCRFGDPPARSPEQQAFPEPPRTAAPVSVLLVTIDTLRPDHSSTYGYALETTPELSKLAERGRRFTRAYTTGGWTCLALPTLATGVSVRDLTWHVVSSQELGIIQKPGGPEPQPFTLPRKLPHPLLPWWLKRRRMLTLAAFSSQVPFLHSRRWQHSFDRTGGGELDTDVEITDAALDLLAHAGRKPFFLWVHYFGPHDLYDGGARRDESAAHYDETIQKTDAQLGRLLRAATAAGQRIAVIVTSDHGEVLDGGTRYHGIDLSEASIRIPLVIAGPGVEPGPEDTPASLADIFPTVLAWTETPGPSGLAGVDLRHLPKDRIVITDLIRVSPEGEIFIDQLAAATTTSKLTVDLLTGGRTLVEIPGSGEEPKRRSLDTVPPQMLEAVGAYLERQDERLVQP